MKQIHRIPTLIGIFVLVIGIAGGVLLVGAKQIFRIGASNEIAPKDVRISNITDSSFTISWTTSKETVGFVKWGSSQNSLQTVEQEGGEEKKYTHSLTIRTLSASSTYYFKVNSDGYDYDNNGVAWQATTGQSLGEPTDTKLASGSILTPSGTPYASALVYLIVGGGSLLSTTTSPNGNWIIPISLARSQDLESYVSINDSSTLIEISVNAGVDGVASAQIYPTSAKPAPPIILGQVHDFRNLPPSAEGESPNAEINLPDKGEGTSGFNPGDTTTAPSQTVTLESHDEAEIVSSTKPEFFGDGPPGEVLTITVESDPISGQATVTSAGTWNWSPPDNLAPGTHTLKITWRDASGILRTITRTFIVQAAEGPAFESTPSATPTTSPKSSPTGTPKTTSTPTAKPSGTATASAKPTLTATPSAVPVPDSGTLAPSYVLLILGASVLAFSIFFLKKGEVY